MPVGSFEPYSPPRDGLPMITSAPLPPGFRRFRLDPVLFGPLVTRGILRTLMPMSVIAVGFVLIFNMAIGQSPSSTAAQIGALALVCALILVRRRSITAKALRAYELLMGPRVLRRVGSQLGPAEILRPEVTQIVETSDGLWLSSQVPVRSLFVARAIDGYADVRAELAAWHPIESARGWAAWRMASRAAERQGHRDAVLGTALASDSSLRDELEIARAASSVAYLEEYVAPKRRLVRWSVLWGILILMFGAIWVFLSHPPP
jgi:hypothetical protein